MKNMSLLKLHGLRLLVFFGSALIISIIYILVVSSSVLQDEVSPLLFIWIPFLADIITVIKLKGGLLRKTYDTETERLQKFISLAWYYGDYIIISLVIITGIKSFFS